VGYVGEQQALDVVIGGLRRLEYRGYDSAGVALVTAGKLATDKRAGKLVNLTAAVGEHPLPAGTTGMGHTRWATHGAPNDRNAHPHVDCTGSVAVIHNGIIENFARLRADLERRGHELASETDTEVVAHLLEDEYAGAGSDLAEAMRRVCRRLEGAFTLVAVHVDAPDVVVGARRNSPLVVGRGEGENFLASDVAAFIAHTREAIELGQDQVVELRREGVVVTTFDGAPAEVKDFHVDWDPPPPRRAATTTSCSRRSPSSPRRRRHLLGRVDEFGRLSLDEMRLSDDELREIDKIIIIACGHVVLLRLVAKYAIEHWTRIPCEVELASEFRYRDPILDRATLVVAISQSGRDDGHPDGAAARPGTARAGSRDLQHQRLDDPARVRRGALHPRRPRDRRRLHQGVPDPDRSRATSWRSYLGQLRGTSGATRCRASCATSRRCPAKLEQVLERMGRSASWRVRSPTTARCSSWAATWGSGGARRCAQAQGARLHARRGYRRGAELKHGPDRGSIEPRPCPSSVVVPPLGAQRPPRQGRQQHPGRSALAAPGRS
jgi:hypothetical protein